MIPVVTTGAIRNQASKAQRTLHQEVWNTENGFPQNTVPAILQSRDGYIWSGTELGLVRFDGAQFTTFDKRNTAELKSNKVDALLEDRDGNLWIGTLGGGLTRKSGGKFRTYTTENGLSGNSIRCLLQDTNGDLWIGTNGNGLNRMRGERFQSFRTEDGLADNQIFSLIQAGDGSIWVATHEGLSHLVDGRAVRTYKTGDGLSNNYVRSLAIAPDQTIWIGTDSGLSRLRNGKLEDVTAEYKLSRNAVVALRMDRKGALWMGTLAAGIVRLENGETSTYTSRDGLPANDVWSIYQDRAGDNWIGTGGGGLIRLFSQTLFNTFDTGDGLSHNMVLPVFQDRDGALWMGTNGGGLNRRVNGEFTNITTKDGLANNVVFSICQTPDGALWFGTRKGLSQLKDGKFTTFGKREGLPSEAIVALYSDSRGALWIGTRAGLTVRRNKTFTTYTTSNGLSNNVVQSLFEDSKHRMWIGTGGGGLNMLANGQFKVFDSRNGLSNDVVFALHESNNGSLWIGTDGGGLNRWKNDKFTWFNTKDGLTDDAIFRILEDQSGALWMSSNKGVFRATLKSLNDFADGKKSRIEVLSYGVADGMKTRECNGGFQPAGWKGQDGRLWFPTMRGVVVANPTTLTARTMQQPTIIEQVLVNDQDVTAEDGIEIPVGAGRVEVHYTAPNFRAAHLIDFQYKLDGFDSGWVHAGQRRVAYYTNIPPGNYHFRVAASNQDGSWSTATALQALKLQPHFYQTFFFYSLCAFGMVALATAGHMTRVRHLHMRKRELEQHVEERTAALRKEIAERELAELESVRAREVAERASLVKSEFLANMSHEIRTPMNGILGMTTLTLASALDSSQRQYLEIIKDSADSLLTVIDDILDFSKVEAGKLELNPIDFDLRSNLDAIIKSLLLRAEQKEIRLSCQVDSAVPAMIQADPGRLRQIVLNLVGNSLKFTNQGEVAVEVFCDHQSTSNVSLRFIVRDTGIGIAEDKLTSIFDAFSQADSSTTRKFGGTGLGLAICNRLVRLMGGKIWVTSELGHGSQFHFTMVAGVAAMKTSRTPDHDIHEMDRESLAALAKACSAEDIRVLLAEDNPANRLVARLTLEHAGFRVVDVENGQEALNAIQTRKFDLVLMDCRMPVMDGYVATQKIRALPHPANKLPIIALTASAFKEDRERAEEAGMDDFVAKPFEDRDVIAKCLYWARQGNDVHGKNAQQEARANNSQVSELRNSGRYSPEFLQSMMEIFIETAPPVFETLLTALNNNDWAQAKSSAHWLRGGASRIIGPEFQKQLELIEKACTAEAPVVSAAEVRSLTDAFQQARQTAETWPGENKAFSAAR